MPESALLSDENMDEFMSALPTSSAWEDGSETQILPIGQRSIEVITTRRDHKWIAYCVTELNNLAELPENWDSYGALRVDQGSLEQACKVYLTLTQNRGYDQLPYFTATPDGGVGLMWHQDDKGLEVEVDGPLFIHGHFYDDTNDDREWSDDVSLDIEVLNRYLDEVFG